MGTDKDYTKTNVRPALYVHYYAILRNKALECGYNLVVHGSLQNDFDLIAIPWIEKPKPVEEMLAMFCKVVGYSYSTGLPYSTRTEKPHGRIAYTLDAGGGAYFDISVMPIKE